MLRDTLLEWCQREYDQSPAKHCGCKCNNKEACHHSCDDCLDQVHWYPRYGGRSDYTCPYLLLRYVSRFTARYSQQIYDALSCVDITQYPYFNIFSIGCGGCGATPDLMAFEENAEGKKFITRVMTVTPYGKIFTKKFRHILRRLLISLPSCSVKIYLMYFLMKDLYMNIIMWW